MRVRIIGDLTGLRKDIVDDVEILHNKTKKDNAS